MQDNCGSEVRGWNRGPGGVSGTFPRASQWTTLGLVRAEVGPLYLYYGENGEPSTFDPAGKHWIPAHLRAEACTFEGKIYGSEP